MSNEEYKSCPYCGEDVKTIAIKCKHCQSFLVEESENSESVKELLETQKKALEFEKEKEIKRQEEKEAKETEKAKSSGCLILTIVIAGIIFWLLGGTIHCGP